MGNTPGKDTNENGQSIAAAAARSYQSTAATRANNIRPSHLNESRANDLESNGQGSVTNRESSSFSGSTVINNKNKDVDKETSHNRSSNFPNTSSTITSNRFMTQPGLNRVGIEDNYKDSNKSQGGSNLNYFSSTSVEQNPFARTTQKCSSINTDTNFSQNEQYSFPNRGIPYDVKPAIRTSNTDFHEEFHSNPYRNLDQAREELNRRYMRGQGTTTESERSSGGDRGGGTRGIGDQGRDNRGRGDRGRNAIGRGDRERDHTGNRERGRGDQGRDRGRGIWERGKVDRGDIGKDEWERGSDTGSVHGEDGDSGKRHYRGGGARGRGYGDRGKDDWERGSDTGSVDWENGSRRRGHYRGGGARGRGCGDRGRDEWERGSDTGSVDWENGDRGRGARGRGHISRGDRGRGNRNRGFRGGRERRGSGIRGGCAEKANCGEKFTDVNHYVTDWVTENQQFQNPIDGWSINSAENVNNFHQPPPIFSNPPPTFENHPSSTHCYPPPAFGNPPPAYGKLPPDFGNPPPAYGNLPPAFGNPPPVLHAPLPVFQNPPQTFSAQPPQQTKSKKMNNTNKNVQNSINFPFMAQPSVNKNFVHSKEQGFKAKSQKKNKSRGQNQFKSDSLGNQNTKLSSSTLSISSDKSFSNATNQKKENYFRSRTMSKEYETNSVELQPKDFEEKKQSESDESEIDFDVAIHDFSNEQVDTLSKNKSDFKANTKPIGNMEILDITLRDTCGVREKSKQKDQKSSNVDKLKKNEYESKKKLKEDESNPVELKPDQDFEEEEHSESDESEIDFDGAIHDFSNEQVDTQNKNKSALKDNTKSIGKMENLVITSGDSSGVRETSKQKCDDSSNVDKLFHIGQLTTLSQKDADELVLVIKDNYHYVELFKQSLDPNAFILVVKILSKICLAENYGQERVEILGSNSLNVFLNHLFEFITELPFIQDKGIHPYIDCFFENVITLYETLVELRPSASQLWRNHIIEVEKSIKSVKKNLAYHVNENSIRMVQSLKEDLQNSVAEVIPEQDIPKKNTSQKGLYFPEPVGDFRTVPLYPRPEDVYQEQPFLYPNITEGPYQSVDHYLDIHFKLLREDFMSPIRQALKDYKRKEQSKDKTKRIDNVRIYRRVKFLHPKTITDKMGFEICFDVDNKLNRINWEFANRFMFGSLLLFTSDNFDSFFLGTVANRNIRELERKLVTVELVDAFPNAKSILGKEFIMAESQAYFNPYYQVLKALQWLNKENFPLARYIVGANTDTFPPHYLSDTDVYRVTAGDGNTLQFRVLSDAEWPVPEDLGLDQSQYDAFKAALTNDLTVIQGPPGTGKTYLGLKIAKALLANSHVWNKTSAPIFVVCFTNHALDQFLEGLLPVTSKLIRIGGKSKGTELDKFNIRDRRREFNYYKKSNTRLSRELSVNMSRVFAEVKTHQTNLQLLDDTEGIVSSKTLHLVMRNDEQRQYIKNDDALMSWLLAGVSKRETSVKITITEDRGILREETIVDPEAAVNEDFRVAQTFFDAIELDSAVSAPEGTVTVHFACVLNTVKRKLDEISQQLNNRNLKRSHMIQLKTAREDLDVLLKHLTRELKQKRIVGSDVEKEILLDERNLYRLTSDQRWKLYHLWVNIMRNGLIVELGTKEKEFRGLAFSFEQLREADDINILKTSHVVGTTTTIAAKFQAMFTALAPKIVIVEEAAEVLEAHVLASLPPSCEHLILIGDHKQLRPSVASDWLARQYQLDVSLFERMVRNGMACHTLQRQHRMRPEISQQLVPTIYPTLLDHESVHGRENVRGMNKNVFFLTHNRHEDDVAEITSKRNVFEAEVLLNLAKYLVQQGYKPSEITILATYKGQMYHLKNEVRKMDGFPKGIFITVVDNFQGEENKIILLSLVRSNPMKKIGFLEIENRVCVALSRARCGLYIVGNMDILCHSSSIWPNIRDSLKRQEAVGPELELRCQVHPDQLTRIRCGGDFCRVSEGGCSLICGQTLKCGHACKSMCHISADYHNIYKCKMPCQKILCEDGHQCPKMCHQRCGECQVPMERMLPCGHFAKVPCSLDSRLYMCETMVEVDIPLCGHKVKVKCHMRHDPECNTPCINRLNCGHSCDRNCHVDDDPEHTEFVCYKKCEEKKKGCTANPFHPCKLICYEECQPCLEIVERTLPCGHNAKVQCSADLDAVNCKRRCDRILDCGHGCTKKCHQDCYPCTITVEKTVKECGHSVKISCNQMATKQQCNGSCQVRLDCGHLCAKRCCDPCSSADCTQTVRVEMLSMLCGHSRVELPCNKRDVLDSDEDLMHYCVEPCGAPLSCKHQCSGSCSACMQGRIHQMCNQPCGNVLICGHSCKVPCREVCPPCNQKCTYKCKHSKCPKICGEPCVSCKEPCDYGCEHSKCTKLCGEMCDRRPCEEACPDKLKCGHDCVGFCGEPCPPCYECKPEHFEEFFGTGEETKDAKWVLLEECKHCFEASGLEYWLTIKHEGEIVSKSCPRCKTPVVKTQRFMNLIKETLEDIMQVKQRCFGKIEDIRKQRLNALRKIQNVEFEDLGRPLEDMEQMDKLEELYNKLQHELPEVKMKKRNVVDAQKVLLLCFMTEFFISLYEKKQQVWDYLNDSAKHTIFKKINSLCHLLTRREQKINEQEMNSFESEVKRIHRMGDLLIYTSSPEFKMMSMMSNFLSGAGRTKEKAERIINSTSPYTDSQDDLVKQLLVKLKEQIKCNTEISDSERAMINKAMGSSFNSSTKTGHWFKCKNGHVYCITECGGAMEEAVCPIRGCGEKIGGRNHALRSDQALAREMDGATHAAWSDTANMQNYAF